MRFGSIIISVGLQDMLVSFHFWGRNFFHLRILLVHGRELLLDREDSIILLFIEAIFE